MGDARAKLERCEAAQNVRGKEKKIDGFKKAIAELELKVSQLGNTASNLTVANSRQESSVQIIQNALMAPFTPIEIKREALNVCIPLNGSGSEQNPMQIDGELEM